jgi:phage-related protein
MADIVADLEDAMRGLSDAEQKQLLMDLGFQERSQQRILQLLGTSDAIRQFEKDFKNAGGTVEEVANKQLDTATQQLKLLRNSIVDIFIGSGKEFDEGFTDVIRKLREWVDSIGPAVIEGAGRFADGVDEFVTNAQRIKSNIELFAKTGKDYPLFYEIADSIEFLVDAIKKVIGWWQSLSEPMRESIEQFAQILPWIPLVFGALKILGLVMAAIASPAALVAAAIAGLIVLFQHLWENSETFRGIIQGVIDYFNTTVVPILTTAWDQIQTAIQEFLSWFQSDEGVAVMGSIWQVIQDAAAAVVAWFESDLVPFLTEAWDQIKQVFQAAWDFIVALWDFVLPFLKAAWEAWGEGLINIIGTIWEFIKEIFLGAWQIIEGIFKFFSGLLTLDWEKMWEGIKEILEGAWRIIRETIEGAWEIIWEFLTGVWNTLEEVWEALWEAIKNIAETGWELFIGWIEGVWELFTSFWENSWEDLVNFVGDVLGGLADIVRGPVNTVLGIIEALINNAIGGLNGFIGLINKIPGVNVSSIGFIDIPQLAMGGRIIKEGVALVGEKGPEIVKLSRGAQVLPLESGQPGTTFGDPSIQIGQLVFQGTPASMMDDWRRQTKLALRGL